MNARFWLWINDGWVKLTLRPGQTLAWASTRSTDEGWASEYECFEHDGAGVLSVCGTDGVDCDGRLETHREFYCPLECLKAHVADDGTFIPSWDRKPAYQRDHSAEMAGY